MAVELATAYVSLAVSARGLGKEIESELSGPLEDAAKKSSDKTNAHLAATGKQFTDFGLKAVAAAAVVGGVLLKTGESASNLGESINAVKVTFGSAAEGILTLGENAAQSMGLSNTAFNSLAVQFSSFATTVAGKGGDVVGTMRDMTQRAADFASVMNIDVAQAAEMFQSGLAGETEPLRKYGLDLSAAAVGAYAVANGISSSAASMTEAEKVQARYGLLMEQTSKTQGDFANTSDSAANATRIAKAELENASASIGGAFAPALATAAGLVSSLAGGFVSLNDATGGWLSKGAGVAALALGAAGGLSMVVGQAIKFKASLDKIGPLMKNATGGFTGLGKAAGIAGGVLAGAAVAFAAVSVIDSFTSNAGRATSAMDAYTIAADGSKGSSTGMLDAWKKMSSELFESQGLWSRATDDLVHAFSDSDNELSKLRDGFKKLRDESPEMAKATVAAMEEMLQAANRGDEAAKKWLDTNGLNADNIAGFRKEVTDASGAQEILARVTEENAAADAGAQKAKEDYTASITAATEAHKAEMDALLDQASAYRASADTAYAVIDATDRLTDHTDTLDAKLKDANLTEKERAALLRDGANLSASYSDAVVANAQEVAKRSGVAMTDLQAQDLWNDSMLFAASTAVPEQRQAILDYIGTANGISAEKVTEIKALVDAGKLEEAQALLTDVSAPRDNIVTAIADPQALADLNRDLERMRYASVTITKFVVPPTSFRGILVGLSSASAAGSLSVPRGLGLVGEDGAELVDFRGGERVYNNTDTRGLLSGIGDLAASAAGAGGITVNNYRRDIGVGDLNQVLAMARLAA